MQNCPKMTISSYRYVNLASSLFNRFGTCRCKPTTTPAPESTLAPSKCESEGKICLTDEMCGKDAYCVLDDDW